MRLIIAGKMEEGEERDDAKRKTRNLSEKKRRDQFNVLVAELGSMLALPGGGERESESQQGNGGANANNRKMDKTTVLKSTIAFLRKHGESSARARLHEIREDWKPSFLSNEEFTHLMLEAIEGFILIFGTDGRVVYASESVTSLLGYLPADVVRLNMYDLVAEADKAALCQMLGEYGSVQAEEQGEDRESQLMLRIKRGEMHRSTWNSRCKEQDPEEDAFDDYEDDRYELVKLSGYFCRWSVSCTDCRKEERDHDESGGDGFNSNSDDDDEDSKASHEYGSQGPRSCCRGRPHQVDQTVFVSTAQLQTSRLLRDIPLVNTTAPPSSESKSKKKGEFTSRYSLEWKFLFLDHRAPKIIGYLPFELLGTSGYDYYHFDDLDRITQCHEALMQTGEGTSCFHRFLSKGQQWIWLQTRYYVTYHQWNSKPEFVVATHKVVNYTDVLRDLNGEAEKTAAVNGQVAADQESEVGSIDHRSPRYPTTGSPTWSSRSFSSTGTGRSSKLSDRPHKHVFTDGGASSDDFNCHGSSDFDSISQYLTDGSGNMRRTRHGHHHLGGRGTHMHQQQQQQQQQQQSTIPGQIHPQAMQPQHQGIVGEGFTFALPNSSPAATNPSVAPSIPVPAMPAALLPQPVFIAAPTTTPATVATMAVPGCQAIQTSAGLQSKITLTPAQLQLQEQLRVKHTELMRHMAEQQEELRRISEQLIMSQYGLIPVNMSGGGGGGGSNVPTAACSSVNTLGGTLLSATAAAPAPSQDFVLRHPIGMSAAPAGPATGIVAGMLAVPTGINSAVGGGGAGAGVVAGTPAAFINVAALPAGGGDIAMVSQQLPPQQQLQNQLR